MNAPPALVLLFGNWVGFLVALAVGAGHVLLWYQNQATVPWWVLAAGLFVIAQALRVRWRYRRYKDWQEAADEMSGAADARRAAVARRRPWLIALGSLVLWLGCLWWVGTHPKEDPTTDVAAALWLGVSLGWLWLGVRRLWRWVQRKRADAQRRSEREHVVTVAVAQGDAPTLADAVEELPDYAKKLLKRSAAEHETAWQSSART